jgi:hypothetical protein
VGDVNINIGTDDQGDDTKDSDGLEQLVPGDQTGFEDRAERIRDTAIAEGDLVRSGKRWLETIKKGLSRKR